jgi:hypothetical protein
MKLVGVVYHKISILDQPERSIALFGRVLKSAPLAARRRCRLFTSTKNGDTLATRAEDDSEPVLVGSPAARHVNPHQKTKIYTLRDQLDLITGVI